MADREGVDMAERTCSIEECERSHAGRGWCNLHYQRWKTHGNPLHPVPKRERNHACKVEDCDVAPRSRTSDWCAKHYHRWYTTGDENHQPARGRVFRKDNGYMVVYDPGHPMAGPQGSLLEHRAVLFDRIGLGPHRCYWCEEPVNWFAGLHVHQRCEERPHHRRRSALIATVTERLAPAR